MKKIILLLGIVLLTGCAELPNTLHGNPNANKPTSKKFALKLPAFQVEATFNYGNDPEVVKAYDQFVKTGKAPNIKGRGFKTLAYDRHTYPIIKCAPGYLCVLQLEQGERINNISIGDSSHWLVDTALIGTKSQGSYQLTIQPKDVGLATDLIVTTTKRTYNIGLVSRKGSASDVVNLYYPEETLSEAVHQLNT